MNTEKTGKGEKSTHKGLHTVSHEGLAKAETLLPSGSWQRVAVGVAAAAGGGLIAAAMLGVGPAAIAGAAGYLAYRGLSGEKKAETGFSGHRH